MSTDDLTHDDDDDILDSPHGEKGRSGILAGLAFLFALASLAISALLWLESHDSDSPGGAEMQARIASLEENLADQSGALTGLKSQVSNLPSPDDSSATDAVASTLSEQQSQTRELAQELELQRAHVQTLQQALEAMQARLMATETELATTSPGRLDAPREIDLAAVGYLLRLAPERLEVFHDLQSADQALAMADAQLAAMDNPVYVGVRRRIAESRIALADADLPDQVEISARLDGIQGQIEGLQFEAEVGSTGSNTNVAVDAGDANPGWWARLKASLAGLVTVRRSAEGEQSRLTLEDKDLLRQGLWMQVEGARLALMRHDQPAWEDALSRASSALERWFLESTANYQAVSQGFDDLATIDIDPELPDISGPWAQFELIRKAGSAALPPPAPVEPVPGKASPPEENDEENDSPAASDEAAEDAQSDGQA